MKGDNSYFEAAVNAPYEVNSCSSSVTTNHMVVLVGYTPTHYIIKNSWGPSWGDGGYAYVKRTSDCGIKGFVEEFRTGMNASTYPTTTVNLVVNMTDSGRGTGWGWTFGIKQNGTNITTFTLPSGFSGVLSLCLNARIQAEITVVSFTSSSSSEIGFKIYTTPSNAVLY